MVNIVILLFTFVFLVTQNILLLNEEFLILLCFITFVLFILNNLSNTINEIFKTQSIQVASLLKNSLNQILQTLNQVVVLKDYSSNLLNKFVKLKFYYCGLMNVLANFIPNYNKVILQVTYQNRLLFLNKVEKQTIKLLIIILLKKLTKIIKIKNFYEHVIKSPQFLSLELISLRECICLTNLKNK